MIEDGSQTKTNIWVKYCFLLVVAIPVVIIDQITKFIVRNNLELEETWVPWPWVDRFGRIVHWKNEGSAFNLLSWNNWVFVLLALIGVVVIVYYFPRIPQHDWTFRLSMGLLLGGIIGNNLIDRMFLGYVTDFIMVGYFDVFNLADVSNFAGLIVLVAGYLAEERKNKSMKKE
ncbi:MAG: signal peptidase II [Anaerolineales bacterium]|nr:signal peptidase II [Anaerolineales bacterium]